MLVSTSVDLFKTYRLNISYLLNILHVFYDAAKNEENLGGCCPAVNLTRIIRQTANVNLMHESHPV